ncbi:ribonuclease H-like domain-containing protein [Tanacetum coccineum]|uniref:Ribonuclease H-like domain-containing protein n=1 Tax=Tanacetum coccineum TaxID=301880 RepID=A0ABQ5HQS2_9ASTR
MWRLRIEQYFQVQHYALWDVIENGNSFKLVAQTTTNGDGTSTSLIPGPVTTEEKAQKKNDVKAKSMLLMALPNEHLMTFNQYKDAKTLIAAIQTRFGGNDATKKTYKTLLKQITNEVNTTYRVSTANTQVSPASTQVSTASTQVSTANLSDDTVYAFLASQPNGSQLVYEDLEQIHEDDIKEMDLKWQLALLSMRTRRGPRNQDSRNNQDNSRRTVNVEETSSKAMVAIDGSGFDWSYMTDDEVPTNMALMDFSDFEVHNDKTCLKSFETLKTQLDNLRIEFNKSEFNLATYKRGLTSVEEQLIFYKKNKVIFYEQLAVLKRDISYKDSEISMLKSELEKLKQEKESNQLKIENFDNASKSLDKLIGSQIPDKRRKGVGFVSYNAVSPPPTGLFSPPKFDLSNSGLEEFQQPKFEGYGPKTSKSVSENFSKEVRESPDTPLVEKLVLDDKLEKKTGSPNVTKIEFVRPKQQEKPVRKPVKYAEMYRSQSPRGNQRNWNNQKSQQLGSDFVMYNKACFVCGSFDHVQANYNYHQRERVVSRNNYTRVNYNYSAKKTHPNAHKNMVPRAVLMKTSLRSLNTARPVNTAHPKTIVYSARPMSHFSKSAQSTVKRPYQTRTALTNKNFSQKVNTARPNSAVVNAVRENQGHPQKEDQGYVDSGCSRHMTGNMSYLSDFKEFDGGYVTFGGGAKGGKITATKDETSGILKSFITEIENLVDKKVKIIRYDNETEFKNRVMSKFCKEKGIKKEFSAARTPQQNGVAKRRNRTLIEAARTMLADSKLPTTFWVEAVNTACYVQNRVLVVKPHNKTPYELFRGKFDGKSDKGFFVGYSLNSKAFRVYNIRTRKVKENLHIRFLEDKPIIAGNGPKWLFDIDVLTKSMNYVPVVAGDNATLEATHADFFGDETEVDMSKITTTYLTRRMTKTTNEQGFISAVYEGKIMIDLYTVLFAYFLSQVEPKEVEKLDGTQEVPEVHRSSLLFFLGLDRIASTPMETSKPLVSKAAEAEDVDVTYTRFNDWIIVVLLAPRCHDKQGDRPAQTRFDRLSKQSNKLPLLRVYTLGIGEDSMKLQELMDLYTKLSNRVLDLENVKDAQALEIQKLKKRVKKLESKKKTMRRPTLGLLILPSVSPFTLTIRRTARISFLPTIEPNLAERTRISAINLDDYQLDPVTPPPSPSSPFTMAVINEFGAIPETALIVCTSASLEDILTIHSRRHGTIYPPIISLFRGVRSLHDTVGCKALRCGGSYVVICLGRKHNRRGRMALQGSGPAKNLS